MEPGCKRTEAEPVGLRIEAEQEGRRSPMELKWWRDEALLKARKSMVQAG